MAWSAGEALAAGETVATTHGERRHERYRSKKWLRDIGKDFDMIRMMTMVMKDDDGDDDGAWLNCDTTIARQHCGQPCFPSYAFPNTPSLWDRHGACKCYELHCPQERNQTQSKEIKSNQKTIEQSSNAINTQSQNHQTQSKRNQAH